MENLVPLGTGNSRLMKSNIPASTTLAQLIQMLNNGTFPYDIGPLNPAGISQQGTPLNKATLFSDDTAALYPEGVNNPNDALEYLRKYGAGATATYPAAVEITAGDVCDVVDGKATTLYEEYVVSIADTAIALNSASPGEDVRLLFGGSATLPGATAGTEIVSEGILGEVPIDGMVTALSKGIRNKLAQIYTGSYTGTGTYGENNPNTLTFPFEPKFFVCALPSMGLYPASNNWQGSFIWHTGVNTAYVGTSNITISVSGNTLQWYSTSNDTNQLNNRTQYFYIAIG